MINTRFCLLPAEINVRDGNKGNRGDTRTKPSQQKEGVGSHGHTERRAQALRRSAGEVSSEEACRVSAEHPSQGHRVPEPETRRSRSVHGREAAALVLGLCLNASCHRYWSSGNALWAWEAPGNCKCSGSEDLSSAGWEAVQWHLRKHFWDGKLGDKMETSGSFILVKTRALPQIRPKGSHTKANPCSAWWNPAFFWGTIHIFPP